MNKYTLLSLPVVLGCFLGSCAIGALTFAIIVADSLVPGLTTPNSYLFALNFPMLSVILPVVGMLLLAPTALYLALTPNAPAKEVERTESITGVEATPAPANGFLKAA